MNIRKKLETKPASATSQNIHVLSAADLLTVSGGINPQPLPPCRAAKQ